VRNVVVDSGFLAALFDESDAAHARCRAFLRDYHGRFLTTQAALAQSLALLSNAQQLRFLEWLAAAAQAGLVEVDGDPMDFRSLENIARGHGGRPIDLADASLVLLVWRTGVREILAADPRELEAYRMGDRARFIELSAA
jgi:predicted nucleic acid-binding protein